MKAPGLPFIILALLAALVVAFFYGRSSEPDDAEGFGAWEPVTPEAVTESGKAVDALDTPEQDSGAEPVTESEPEALAPEESAQEAARRQAMLGASELLAQQTRALGYFDFDDRAVYASYSLDQLESLLEQGDLRAYPVILDQHANDASQEYLTWVSFRAAIQGSTPAIGMLAHLESSRAQYERLMENDPESRERLLHAQALFKAATELGDPFMGGTAKHQLKQQDYELTEQDQKQIDTLSKRFLETLDQRRQEQGFGPLERASEDLKAEYERLGISSSPWEQ